MDQTPTASLWDFCEALSIMTEIMVPQPDPTLLTTAQLTREIATARVLRRAHHREPARGARPCHYALVICSIRTSRITRARPLAER
jgi:hypothetical protein